MRITKIDTIILTDVWMNGFSLINRPTVWIESELNIYYFDVCIAKMIE